MELNMENVKQALQAHKDDTIASVNTLKDELTKGYTDHVAEQVNALETKIAEFDAGIKAVEENLKKQSSFFPTGSNDGREAKALRHKWSWSRFFKGCYQAKLNNNMKEMEKHAPDEFGICKEFAQARAYEATDGSSGGFLVPPEIYQGDIIETTYAQTPMLQLPIPRLENMAGDIPVPVDSGNLTAYWVGENGKPTATSANVGLEWLRPKKIGVFVKVSNRLVAYANKSVDAWIKGKMANDASVLLDQGLIRGTGSEHQVRGVLNHSGLTSAGVCSNSGRFVADDMISMVQSLAVANELRTTPTYGGVMRPEIYFGLMRQQVIQYSGQARKAGSPVMAPMYMFNAIEGIEKGIGGSLKHTTNLNANEDPAGATSGASETFSTVVYGDWSKTVYSSFRDPIFKVSDVAGDGSTGSAFLEDQLYLVMFLECDFRVLRATALAKMTGCETTVSNWSVA